MYRYKKYYLEKLTKKYFKSVIFCKYMSLDRIKAPDHKSKGTIPHFSFSIGRILNAASLFSLRFTLKLYLHP